MALGGRSKNHPRSIKRADEMAKALDLARAGLSVRQIAKVLKCGHSKAHDLIEKGRKDIPAASRDALIAEIHERELAIVAAHWTRRGDPKHAAVIQASDQFLARMFGLEATKATVLALGSTNAIEDGPEALARAVREVFGEKAARPEAHDDLAKAVPHGDGGIDHPGSGSEADGFESEGFCQGGAAPDAGGEQGDRALREGAAAERDDGSSPVG